MSGAEASRRLAWYASVARMAPSKHNTQPWRFRVRDGALTVEPDHGRALRVTDPGGRELVLSCGAAVQGAVVAARAHGVELEVEVLPEGPTGPLARLREGAGWSPTPHDLQLLDAARRRRTDRGPLDGGALGPRAPFLLQDVAAAHGCTLRLVQREGEQETLARATERADAQLTRSAPAAGELRSWLRPPGEVTGDGVPWSHTRGPVASRTARFVQRDFGVLPSEAAHDRPGTDAPLLAVLCSPADGVADRLLAGRALMAVLLELTVLGGAASFLDQALELPHTRALLQDELDLPGAAQVVLRAGVGGRVGPVPRRPLEELLRADDDT